MIDPAKIREAMQRAQFDGKEYPIERAAIQAVLEAIADQCEAARALLDGRWTTTTNETETAKAEATRKAEERLTSMGRRKLTIR